MGEPAVKWWNRIPAILTYPLNVSGAIAVGALLVAGLIETIGSFGAASLMGKIIAAGITFAIVFLVIRHSARGSTVFPAPAEIEDPVDDVIVPGFKVLILAIVLYAPAIYCFANATFSALDAGGAAMMMQSSKSKPKPRPEPAGNPWALPPPDAATDRDDREMSEEEARWAAIAAMGSPEETSELQSKMLAAAAWFFAAMVVTGLCTLVYPLCLIILAMSGSLRAALFPVTWFVILWQVPLGYLGLLVAIAIGGGAFFAVTLPLSFLPIPLLPSIATAAIRAYFVLCGSHLLGWFVFQNRARLGIQDEPERRDVSIAEVKAMATGAAPHTYRPAAGMVRVGSPVPNAAPGPLHTGEVPGGPPMAPMAPPAQEAPADNEIAGLHARFQAACAARDIAAVQQSAPLLVDAYFQAGNVMGAAEVYGALVAVSPETSLGPERQARLAKELENTLGDLNLAMTAWRTLAFSHPEHPRAPNALWRCAEICAKSSRRDWEASACQAILARYPMSEVAPLATARLKRLTQMQQQSTG